MSLIKTYAISCSSDVELDVRKLYVWGGLKSARFLPDSLAEAKRRVKKCQAENKCQNCDAEIHEIKLERTKKTLKQQ
jgi:hypothetical protein